MSDRRVWVGCLACYNAGTIEGEWLTPAEGVAWACPVASHGETWVFDHEGFGSMLSGECSPAAARDLDAIASRVEGLGADLDAVAAWVSHAGIGWADLGGVLSGFWDQYCGVWESELRFAEDLFDELYSHDVSDAVSGYIDYEKFSRDLFLGDYWSASAPNGMVHVFRGW